MKTLLTSALCCGMAGLLSSSALLAAEDEIEIIITAGRKAQTADETLASVSVINRRDIENSQASSVTEVLNQVAGLSITSSGGLGKQSSVHLRGTHDKHVLVLVDGIKVGSATLGTTAFEYLPLEQVERIEVVRGPRSSLYGSEAIGGVIQIFTRKGGTGGKGIRPEASLGIGSHNTRKAAVNLSTGNEDSWLNLNASTVRTDGINALDSYLDYPPPSYAPTQVSEPDKDGHTSNSLSLRAGHRLENGISTEVSLMRAEGDSEFDGSFQNSTDFVQQVVSGKVSAPLGSTTTITAQAGQSRDEQDSFKDGIFASRFDTTRDYASLQADSRVADNTSLTLGTDYQRDRIDSSDTYTVDSRRNNGMFANLQTRLNDNKLDVSVRRDHNEQFGNKTTGGVALAHEFAHGLRATAAWGTAFKAPSFNDLYYPYGGNPDLTPENSRNIEFGIHGRLSSGEWSINAFQNKISDLIEWQDVGGGIWQPMNVDSARIRGLEAEVVTRIGDWRTTANATVQQPELTSGVNKGNTLTYRPEHLLNLGAERDFGAFSAGANLHAESGRYADVFNSGRVPGFATLDLHGKYRISKDVSLGLKVGNVLDKSYELNRGYNQDGRNAMLTLEYKPR